MKCNVLSLGLVTLAAGSLFSTAAAGADKMAPSTSYSYYLTYPAGPTWGDRPYGTFPWVGGATPASAQLHGESDVIRGLGEYNLNTSQAMVNGQQAYSAYLDNRKKKVETYYEMRRIHDEAVAASRKRRSAPVLANRAPAHEASVRPVAFRLSTAAGELAWPVALSGTEFRAERQTIDNIWNGAELSEQTRAHVQQLAGDMQARLLDLLHNREVNSMDYVASKKFLTSLSSTASADAGVESITPVARQSKPLANET